MFGKLISLILAIAFIGMAGTVQAQTDDYKNGFFDGAEYAFEIGFLTAQAQNGNLVSEFNEKVNLWNSGIANLFAGDQVRIESLSIPDGTVIPKTGILKLGKYPSTVVSQNPIQAASLDNTTTVVDMRAGGRHIPPAAAEDQDKLNALQAWMNA
ncbi:MAG: hypothetical protein ACE14V_01350 [bacterium]